MAAQADLLVLDIDTNGGRLDVTEQILRTLAQFKGYTVSYVNTKALSAGAFIAFGTRQIYMAPGGIIGAATPLLLGPNGVAQMPESVEAKMNSAVRAMVRASAETNGYNLDVVEAMIDRTKELKIDDEVLNQKGQILTLTAIQAAKEYGEPKKPLLSSGTVLTLDELLTRLNHSPTQRANIQPTGLEQVGAWLNAVSPILLIVGMIGVYLEIKTPGFGLPGIVGIVAFTLYFFGGYVAGLSGLEWLILFFLGLGLVLLEFFIFPGTFALGLAGLGLILVSLVMSMVDIYPGGPIWPTLPQLRVPLGNLFTALLATVVIVALLSRWLPKTSLYHTLVSQSASGVHSVAAQINRQTALIGLQGTAISNLRPGGKAQFGDQLLDVLSRGDLIPKGRRVKIVGYSGHEAVVEPLEEA